MQKILVLIALLLTATAVPVAAKSNIPPTDSGQVVLVVNALEPDLTNAHLGATAFTNYQKNIQNHWSLPATLERHAGELLTGAGYRVVSASVPNDRLQMIRDRKHIRMGWSNARLNPDFATWLGSEMAVQGAIVAIILGTHSRPFAFNVPGTYEGYGVMSMHGKKPKHAYLFANVYAAVISGQPLGFAQETKFNDSNCRTVLPSAEIAVDSFENLSAELLAPYRQAIEALAERRLKLDLVSSGLIPGKIEKCIVAPG